MDIFGDKKNVQNEKTAKSLQNHLEFDYYIMDTKTLYYLEGPGGAHRAGGPWRKGGSAGRGPPEACPTCCTKYLK